MAGKRRFRDAVVWWVVNNIGAKMLKDLLQFKWLENHRTKVAAVLISVVTLSLNLGWIDEKTYTSLIGFLTSLGLLAARYPGTR